MKTSWQNVKISYLGSIKTGKTPKTFISDNYGGKILFLTPSDDMEVKYIRNTGKKLTQKGMEEVKNCLLPKDAVCVSCIGSDLGKVVMTTEPTVTNQQINSIVVNKEICDANFCYYRMIMLGKVLNYHGKISTAVPIVNKTTFSNYEILLPPMSEQKKIAKILSVLDDKIELNNKINQNLESQAQTLFKSWFVDKEYSIAENTTLGNICKCELGGTPSRAKPEYWNGNIAWINSGEVNNFRITKASEYITDLGLQKSATKLLPKKTTVLAITGATLGQISLLEIDSCANQSVVGILENDILPYEFIYPFICYNIQDLISHQTGGAQQHINKQNVESLPLALPTKDLINDYRKIVKPIFDMIAKNCFENEKLIAIRDALLPKLMSGEIDVENLPQSAIIPNE